MSLRIEALSRHAVARRVLDRVSLQLGAGEFLALLGPAGSGRRALLRMLAGLEEPDAGRILLDGRDVTRLPPGRRGVGCLFRRDPLFGHPTVFDAVAAALPEEGGGLGPSDAAATGARVRHLLGLAGLAEDGGRMPAMLPPEKRHRLALARALAAEPRLLGVGEGFGLADPGRRSTPPPRRWLLDLHRRLGLTTILIAHGPGEALALGDRVAVLNAGRVEQVGTPAELRRRPATAFVAETLRDGAAAPWVEAMAQGGVVPEGRPPGGPVPPPGALEAVDAGGGTPARVLGATALGATLRLELQLLSDGRQVEAEVPSPGLATQLPPGTIIGLRLRGGRVACSEGGPPSRYGIRRHDPAGGSPL